MLRNIIKIGSFRPLSGLVMTQTRCYPALPKRFYKNTGVLESNGKFEITLDNRKLKTPNGTPLVVNSEPLALGVAAEWDSQKDTIDRSNMHLTALVNTAMDNPNKLTKIDIVNYLINYIQTDTVLFHSFEEKALGELQSKEWTPLVEWFNKEFTANIKHTSDIAVPTITSETKMNISNYLNSYDLTALHGFTYAVDTLKSIVLTFAVVKQKISVEQAVLLSRLEEEFQMGHWGRVEWAHDLSQQELQARLAAAVLFIYCNSSSNLIRKKLPV